MGLSHERKNVAEAETLERRAQRRTRGCSHRSPTNAEGCLRSFRVRAVMDAARCERAALFGVSEGGPMSLLFTATYPERVRALILYGCYARRPTLTGEVLKRNLELIDRAWGTGEFFAKTFVPAKASDELSRYACSGRKRSAFGTTLYGRRGQTTA